MTRYYGLYAALLSLCAVMSMYWFSHAAVNSGLLVSPQGCQMSWMSPHYVLQAEFNATWTPLARRYTLWLYREKGFEDGHIARGLPVLFIPGNAGSSRQVRSIASSAARQYYHTPGVVNEKMVNHKPLDIYTVDYNEDFSALHAPTLLKQTDYAQAAIQYILSQYPPGTSIILMGHSMGGIIATALLIREELKVPIRAVITMSTPALLSPVRFDRRAEDVYASIRNAQLGRLQADQAQTPLVAICGGATDPQVGSEACAVSFNEAPYRRTVYTTSAEGVWTGVDHLAMVWCHQVRSLVARATLELANAPAQNTVRTLQQWLKVDATQVKHDPHLVDLTNMKPVYVPIDGRLRISEPSAGLHLLPVPPLTEELASGTHHFTLFVLGGNVYNHRSENLPGDTFKVKVLSCDAPPPGVTLPPCRTLGGEVKLIPNPPRDVSFPAKEGVPETEGLFVFEASVPASKKEKWVGILVEEGVYREGWIAAGFDREEPALLPVAKTDPFGSGVQLTLPHWLPRLHTRIRMPHVLSNALLIYRLHVQTGGECQNSSFPPLIAHEVSEDETQWSNPAQPIYLHSHRTGPFVNSPYGPDQGLTLRVYSSGECGIQQLDLSFAWKESLARFGVRYWQGLAMYGMAVVGCLQLLAYRAFDRDGVFPAVQETMQVFTSPLGTIGSLTALTLLSIIPTPRWFLLGNGGEALFAWVAPAMWAFATGLISTSIYVLGALKIVVRPIHRLLGGGGQRRERSTTKRHIASILGILVLVWTVVPYQVAFLATFSLHIASASTPKVPPPVTNSYVRLKDAPRRSPSRTTQPRSSSASPTLATMKHHQDATRLAQDEHLLLLLLWLLPFAAPVLAVWVRTLQTAGFTVPFDGDHNIFSVLPWLLLGEAASSRRPLRPAQNSQEAIATTCILGAVPLVAVLLGPRYPFVVYEVATFGAAWLAVTRMEWKRI